MIEFTILLTRLDTKLKKQCDDCQCICHPVDESVEQTQTIRQCECLERRIKKLEEMKKALEESQQRKCPETCPCPCDTHVDVPTSSNVGGKDVKSLEDIVEEGQEATETEPRLTNVSELKKIIDENRTSTENSRNPSVKYTEERTSDGFYRKITNVLRLNKKH